MKLDILALLALHLGHPLAIQATNLAMTRGRLLANTASLVVRVAQYATPHLVAQLRALEGINKVDYVISGILATSIRYFNVYFTVTRFKIIWSKDMIKILREPLTRTKAGLLRIQKLFFMNVEKFISSKRPI